MPLFWAAVNGSMASIWRWVLRMTPDVAQQAVQALSWVATCLESYLSFVTIHIRAGGYCFSRTESPLRFGYVGGD